jgi:Chitobiase/beta-hexosaminidase C-terminal domain
MFYTTDGTTPTTSSSFYTGQIVLTGKGFKVVKAIAAASGYNDSAVATATYTVK